MAYFSLSNNALGHLSSSVQFGFIVGTLVFALLTIADRYSPSKVFFWSALAGAGFNLGAILPFNDLATLLGWRFMTGFFLAGIYPVGMKIAADYFQKGLGKSLGFLVGALVLGTAFPHLLKASSLDLSWNIVLMSTSVLAIIGGCLMLFFVPNGPFRKTGQQLNFTVIFKVFKEEKFRSAAFGYFGHMWELYAFWTFVPVILMMFQEEFRLLNINISLLSFLIIGGGGCFCIVGGYLSQKIGVQKTAFGALMTSCICCLLCPFFFQSGNLYLFIGFLFFWGWVVIMDSPLFSTLVAQNVVAKYKGTALTIVNCIGFSITIIAIQCLNKLLEVFPSPYIFSILAIGPIGGLLILAFSTKKAP